MFNFKYFSTIFATKLELIYIHKYAYLIYKQKNTGIVLIPNLLIFDEKKLKFDQFTT